MTHVTDLPDGSLTLPLARYGQEEHLPYSTTGLPAMTNKFITSNNGVPIIREGKNGGMGVLEFPTMNERPALVLASNSPRRKELLALGGWPFEVIVTDTDESLLPDESPRDYVLRLAVDKAHACSARADTSQVILAADTTVVDGDTLLGKPSDPADAERMLRQLRGRVHQVYTGIALLRPRDGNLLTDVCVTDVPMRAYSDEEISLYVATGDPLDKAGAYAIQHADFQPVEMMQGCYASVMGLPLCHVTRLLMLMDFAQQSNVPDNCQSFLMYECPVYAGILPGNVMVKGNK